MQIIVRRFNYHSFKIPNNFIGLTLILVIKLLPSAYLSIDVERLTEVNL